MTILWFRGVNCCLLILKISIATFQLSIETEPRSEIRQCVIYTMMLFSPKQNYFYSFFKKQL